MVLATQGSYIEYEIARTLDAYSSDRVVHALAVRIRTLRAAR